MHSVVHQWKILLMFQAWGSTLFWKIETFTFYNQSSELQPFLVKNKHVSVADFFVPIFVLFMDSDLFNEYNQYEERDNLSCIIFEHQNCFLLCLS